VGGAATGMSITSGSATMNWATKLICGLLLGLSALLSGAAPSQAADRFGVVGIENATHVTVRFQHKWGDRSWNEDVLAPGQRKWFSWQYTHANEDRSPPFHVKFDSDLSPGKFFEGYHLEAYRAPDHGWDFAHKYIFKYDRTKNFIDLFDEKK
jgi:hypothetical protein